MWKYPCVMLLGLLFSQNGANHLNLHRSTSEDALIVQGCGRFKVEFSEKSVRKGTGVRAYFVSEESRNLRPIRFSWTISDGEITKGQGTRSITIKTNNVEGTDVTVTLEVKFYPMNCVSTSSGQIVIRPSR